MRALLPTQTGQRHAASTGKILAGLVDPLAKKATYFAARKKRKLDDNKSLLYMRIPPSRGSDAPYRVRRRQQPA